MKRGSEAERHRIAAAFMRSVALSGSSEMLKVTGLDGEKPLMVAFEEELISDVFARISWAGGYSNLLVVGEGDRMAIVSVLPAASAIAQGEPLSAAEIHKDAEIGMLVTIAKSYSDGLRIPVRVGSVGGDVLSGAESVPAAA